MVEKWSEKDLADLEYAKKHYTIGKKCRAIHYDGDYSENFNKITSTPYLYNSSDGVWILASVNIRNHKGEWSKLEQPIDKIYELW